MNSTQLGIMRSILAEPDCDTPRMVFADACEESGDVERAEFVRLGVRAAESGCVFAQGWDHRCGVDERGYWLCQPHRLRWIDMLEDARFRNSVVPECFSVGSGHGHRATGSGIVEFAQGGECEFHRGFISTIRCSWEDWLAHHKRLFWSPRQTVECPNRCVPSSAGYGRVYVERIGAGGALVGCEVCTSGRIPRPCPDELAATAQPIVRLELTGCPFTQEQLSWESYIAIEGIGLAGQFTRQKCPTCGGMGTVWLARGDLTQCPDCYGRPPINSWTCDAWPGLEIVLPQTPARVEPPATGWRWRVEASTMPGINSFRPLVMGISKVRLEWRGEWDGEMPQPGQSFTVNQPDITVDAYIESVERTFSIGYPDAVRMTAIGTGTPVIRGGRNG